MCVSYHSCQCFVDVGRFSRRARVERKNIDKKGILASAKRLEPNRDLFCRNAVVWIPHAKLTILLSHDYAFSSEIHFCNTSNVLASFFEGGPPLGASLGDLFFHENHIISLVLCVFPPQGSGLWNFFKNVCIHVFHINLPLTYLFLHVSWLFFGLA